MKVGYLLVNESLWKPLIRRQVLDLVKDIQEVDQRILMRVFVIFPWYWYFSHGRPLRLAVKKYRKEGVKISLFPMPLPFPIPYLWPKYLPEIGIRARTDNSSYIQRFLLPLMFPVIWIAHKIYGVEVFHGRGYQASDALRFFKKVYPRSKVIFDPRSAFPEENLFSYSNSNPEKEFRYWKDKELLMLKQSDCTVCISEVYRNHFCKQWPDMSLAIIPNNVDTQLFAFNENDRKSIRKAESFEGKSVFGYLGTMYQKTWHQPSVYAKYIYQLRSTGLDYLVLFIVPDANADFIRGELSRLGVKPREYKIVHPAFELVPAYLSACDFGLFFLSYKKIALSIKVVEYLAVGLPVLVNKNCESAVHLISKERIGAVVDLGLGGIDLETEDFPVEQLKALGSRFSRSEISKIAEQNYSNGVVSQKYAKLYNELYNDSSRG